MRIHWKNLISLSIGFLAYRSIFPLFSLAFALLCAETAPAQVTFAGTQIELAGGSWSSPMGIAADGKGNLFVADRGNNRVVELSPSGSGFAPPVTVLAGLDVPTGVASDWNGDLIVSDTGNGRIVMLPMTNSGFGAEVTVASGLSNPNGLAIDALGNLFVAETGNNSVVEIPRTAGGYGAPVAVGAGFKAPMAVAVDSNRNVFVADSGNRQVVKVLFTAGGYYTQQSYWTTAFTPVAISVDKNFNLYIADSGSKRAVELPWALGAGRYGNEVVRGSGLAAPAGVTTDPSGNVYVTDSESNRVMQVVTQGVLFGAVNVGSSGSLLTYNFNVSAGTTVAAVAILTQGVTGRDFADAGASTCLAQTYSTATVCGVNVAFAPLGSGIRMGAVELFDPYGNALATAFISGVGLEPQAAFIPGVATYLGTELSGPSGVAVDGIGDLFIADTGNNRVLELPWTGSGYGPQTVLPVNGLISPMGVATDGAGNLYIVSNGNDKVVKLPWTAIGYGQQARAGTGLYGPTAVTADFYGNVYIADTLNQLVRKVAWSGSGYLPEVNLGNYHRNPIGIAVDGNGTVYFSDPYQNVVSKVEWTGVKYLTEASVPLTNVAFPSALAVDGNSNLYVLDSINNQVVMLPWTGSGFGSQITVATGFNAPTAMAVDGNENLYVADTGNNQIVKIALSLPGAMNFANTYLGSTSADSARVAMVANIGNQNLTLDSIVYPPDFPEDPGASNACADNSSLGGGQWCELSVDFIPLGAGSPLSEAVAVTDDSLGVVGAQQLLPVSGISLAKSAQTISFPSIPGLVYGVAPVALKASASSGLQVSFTVLSGPGTLLRGGQSLSVNGTGTILVQASQPGNLAYGSAPPVTLSVTVAPAVLTVTPVNATAIYGSIPSSFSYSIGGFVNADNASSAVKGKAAITSSATSVSGAGSYVLTPSQGTLAAANYTFAFAVGTLTVSKACLQVSAVAVSHTYGSPMQALPFKMSGFVNGDSSSDVTGAPLLTTPANSGSSVGTYPIITSSGSLTAQNYNFRTVGGTLTVVPAVLTVVATNLSVTYGSALPALSYSISGFVNGDTAANVVQGAPALAATTPSGAGAALFAGNYSISPSLGSLSAANYIFKFANGTLSILKAVIQVTPANASTTYGSKMPAFSFSLSGFVNGDTQSKAVNGAPSLATPATNRSQAGNFPITASLGSLTSQNYSFAFATGVLAIGKATLTVVPKAGTMIYGGSVPALTYSYSGFVNGDGPSAVQGAPQISTTATAISPVGQYPVAAAPGSMSASNYSFQFATGSITIAPATLTVAANNVAVPVGSPVPALTYSAKGLVNGDTVASATAGAPSLSTNATTSQAGAYPIVAAKGSLVASNYQLTFQNGTLTVAK